MENKKGVSPQGSGQERGHKEKTYSHNNILPDQNKEKDLKSDNYSESKIKDIVTLVKGNARFFHNGQEESFLIYPVGSHEEVHQISGASCNKLIRHTYYQHYKTGLPDIALKTVNGTLSSIASFDGEHCEVFLRVGRQGNSYYIDICNDQWQVVEVNSFGWRILDKSSVYFKRTPTMRPLPVPEKSSDSLDRLWNYINVYEDDQIFIITFILDAFRNDTQFPILELVGQQGSGKSSNAEFIKELIDPNRVNLKAAPQNVEDIFVAAVNNHLVSYNNLSKLDSRQQDALCTLSTGGGYSARKLYTNNEESSVEVKRPVILNGISQVVTASDLLDRCIQIDVPRLKARIPETELKERFKSDKPKILGELFDLLSKALKELPNIHIVKIPRMGDFVLLGEAVSRVWGKPQDAFLNKYNAMRSHALKDTLDTSPIGKKFLKHFGQGGSDLVKMQLKKIDQVLSGKETKSFSPKNLASSLNRIAPALKEAGITVERHKRQSFGYPYSIIKKI